MPDMSLLNSQSILKIEDVNDDDKKIEDEGNVFISISVGVETLIYKKTGLLFLKSKYKSSYIVPRNLRELTQFVGFLYKIENVKLTSKEKIYESLKLFDMEKKIFNEYLLNNKEMMLLEYMLKNYMKFHSLLIQIIHNKAISEKYVSFELEEFKKHENKVIKVKSLFSDKYDLLGDDNTQIALKSNIEKLRYYMYEFYDTKKRINSVSGVKEYLEKIKFLDFTKGKELNLKLSKFMNQDNTDEKRLLLKNNVELFRTYFLNNWIPENIEPVYIDIISEFLTVHNVEKNRIIISRIEKEFNLMREAFPAKDETTIKIKEEKNSKNDEKLELQIEDNGIKTNLEREYKNIINLKNKFYNLSLGDVRVTLDLLEVYENRESVKKFIFSVNTLYSIILYTLNNLDDKEEYREIIGNSIINMKANRFISNNRNKVSRQNIEGNYKEIISGTSQADMLFHFLLSDITEQDRTHGSRTIERSFTQITNTVSGDVLAFLQNTIQPKQHLERFSSAPVFKITGNLDRIIDNYFDDKDSYIGNLEMINDLCIYLADAYSKNRTGKTSLNDFIEKFKDYTYISDVERRIATVINNKLFYRYNSSEQQIIT